jgi:hypothetical protein
MSLPDIDYELRDVGQSEYSVGLANASTPEEMEFVASAFRAGQEKERNRILSDLLAETNNDYLQIAVFKLKNIINNTK